MNAFLEKVNFRIFQALLMCLYTVSMSLQKDFLLAILEVHLNTYPVDVLVRSQSSVCAAGDSAPYARTADFLDGVVIVA